MFERLFKVLLSIIYLLSVYTISAFADDLNDELPTVVIIEKRVANELPAAIKETPISVLRYHPQVDLQTRGIAETQADITIRGGVFETTGIKVGALNLFDPQTGHYTAGLPLPVESLSVPTVLTGIDNSLSGFNSSVATINFALTEILESRSIGFGVGSDNFRLSDIHLSKELFSTNLSTYAGSLSYSSSKGDGSRPNGDHEFENGSLRLQRLSQQSQSDLIISYQDKFFGWPGAYTGFDNLAEIDRTQTALILFNHRNQESIDNWWEVGSYFRALDDDYDFNRNTLESGAPGSFEHETQSYALALQGERALNNTWKLSYASQFTGDELVRSTDLLGGDFIKRRYLSLSAIPTRTWLAADGALMQLRLGANYAWSNEDADKLSPLLGISKTRFSGDTSHIISAEYSSSSQLPGYTVLKSGVSGLFGGNPELGRETSETIEFSSIWKNEYSHKEVNVFYRQDLNLVDWTFSSLSPFARQANAVDIDVSGLELLWQRNFERLNLGVAYSYLHKDEDYGSSLVDASYYALNFANHRLTNYLIWQIQDGLTMKFDFEARSQEANNLRNEIDDAFEASVGLTWVPSFNENFDINFIVDNITNSNFQEFPGTPSTRRSFGLRVNYAW